MIFSYHANCQALESVWLDFGSIVHQGDEYCQSNEGIAEIAAVYAKKVYWWADTFKGKLDWANRFLRFHKELQDEDLKDLTFRRYQEARTHFRQLSGHSFMSDLPELQNVVV